MSRLFRTLTRAQFYRAFLLAQHCHHGWAQKLNAAGIQAHSDPQIGIRMSEPDEMERDSWEALQVASPEQRTAFDLIRRAVREGTDVGDQDLETFALMGSEGWPKEHLRGIWSPGVSDTGKTYHTTATGRLSWSIDREGRVELEICRPGGPLFSVQSWVGCTPKKAGAVQQALDAVSPPAERASSRSSTEANILRDRIAGAMVAQGFSLVFGEDLEEGAEGGPDLVLSIEEAGKDSIVVLQASVNQDGHAVAHQLRAGAFLYLCHAVTMAQALVALGVEWEPQIELL